MKILFALMLVFAQAAQAETISEYTAQLAAEVISLRVQVKVLQDKMSAQERASKESYAALHAYISDFACKHNRLSENVSAGSKAVPAFPQPIILLYGKACDGVSPSPQLPSSF